MTAAPLDRTGRRTPAPSSIARKETTMNTTPDVPDIWYKTQRVLRTIVQVLVILVPTANLAAAAVVGYLGEQTGVPVPGWIFAALNGVVLATALLMGLVARIMAVPGVNALLVKVGLGSVPAGALERGEV